MFVTVDGEDLARKAFRRAPNCIKFEARERKMKEVYKNHIIIYLSEIFHRKL